MKIFFPSIFNSERLSFVGFVLGGGILFCVFLSISFFFFYFLGDGPNTELYSRGLRLSLFSHTC